jgi:para-aminobenzoate synthetase component 1
MTGLPPLARLFEIVYAPYKLFYPGRFVVFSPEQFVSIADGYIRTFPMKGTIDASVPDAAMQLLDDIKEQEEHATVVDLLRNDLSMVARDVQVERYRYITEIRTGEQALLQCSSEISGILDEGYADHLGSIMQALLPAGSVTGAPKKKTVQLIKEIEPDPRGYFTGVFGVYDGMKLDSAVMIRMIEERKDGQYYRSGGGITYRSVAEQEYQEMIQKVYLPLEAHV